jgi:spore maturation protein CgeB
MRILFLGEIGYGQTSLMRMRALQRLGHEVRGLHTIEPWKRVSWFSRQWQRRLQRGRVVDEINRQVLEAASEFRPELIWAEKQEFLRIETLETIRAGGACAVHFTPDPYFSVAWKRTELADHAMKHFDALVYCKRYERAAYESLRRPLVFMPLGFCDETHRPTHSLDQRWSSDVGFLGGWEPRRQRLLAAVARTGVGLKVWGGHWDFLRDGSWTLRRHLILRQLAGKEAFHIQQDDALAATLQGNEVYGEDYALALSGSRIGLGFLRTVCADQHTTRTFEIPACGSMLLADRTDEHQAFFQEGTEAEFFGSEEELVDKVQFYCAQEPSRARIAAAGRQRCIKARYAYIHRLQEVFAVLRPLFQSVSVTTKSGTSPGRLKQKRKLSHTAANF